MIFSARKWKFFRPETQSTGVWKPEQTMDRRVEKKKIVTKTARAKDRERGQEDLLAAEKQGDERKGAKGGKSRTPIEELSGEKRKRTKQERTKSDKKERKRLMPVLIVNHRCSLPTGGRRLQSISSSWRCTGTQCPQLNLD